MTGPLSSLRITAGSLKNKRLFSIGGKEFRPISERVKESLFSIISPYISDSVFLEFFAGTGNVSFEALSRGAQKAYLVERSPVSISLIRKNAEKLKISDKIKIFHSDVFTFKESLSPDILFAGPPYRDNLSKLILSHSLKHGIVSKKTLLIIQHHKKDIPGKDGYRLIDYREYGITALSFFKVL